MQALPIKIGNFEQSRPPLATEFRFLGKNEIEY